MIAAPSGVSSSCEAQMFLKPVTERKRDAKASGGKPLQPGCVSLERCSGCTVGTLFSYLVEFNEQSNDPCTRREILMVLQVL